MTGTHFNGVPRTRLGFAQEMSGSASYARKARCSRDTCDSALLNWPEVMIEPVEGFFEARQEGHGVATIKQQMEGTVAKTISAYDKEVSDDLYGSGSRYVSKQRLEAMLDNEWAQLLTQLSNTRGPKTRFFCFVDTVSARNFAGTNDSHGWIGLRFQLQPGGPPNDVLLHINMRDPSNVLQAASHRHFGRQPHLRRVL
jgi:hypothetical protein